MFNSPVLDLVILLSFTYFIGSLVLSAINEAIAGTFRLRQADLKEGIYRFFLSSAWHSFVKHTFFNSPHIQTLMRAKDKLPAYIPARNFVLAIVENLDGDLYKIGEIKSVVKKNLEQSIPILPGDLLIVLETIMKQVAAFPAAERIVEFENRLEEFYNLTMDRVTGWYKRRVRRILLVLGILLAVVLNIDTIRIANNAIADKANLSKAVDNISANIIKFDSLKDKQIIVKDSTGTVRISQSVNNTENVLLTYSNTTGYALGYEDWNAFKKQWTENFFKKLLGILLTAFALQLGSNYWFDLMNKAVNVRAAGQKPDQLRPDTKKV